MTCVIKATNIYIETSLKSYISLQIEYLINVHQQNNVCCPDKIPNIWFLHFNFFHDDLSIGAYFATLKSKENFPRNCMMKNDNWKERLDFRKFQTICHTSDDRYMMISRQYETLFLPKHIPQKLYFPHCTFLCNLDYLK